MDYQIIIISQNYYEINKDLSTLIIDKCTLEDSNSLTFEDDCYYFEYLIIDVLIHIFHFCNKKLISYNTHFQYLPIL